MSNEIRTLSRNIDLGPAGSVHLEITIRPQDLKGSNADFVFLLIQICDDLEARKRLDACMDAIEKPFEATGTDGGTVLVPGTERCAIYTGCVLGTGHSGYCSRGKGENGVEGCPKPGEGPCILHAGHEGRCFSLSEVRMLRDAVAKKQPAQCLKTVQISVSEDGKFRQFAQCYLAEGHEGTCVPLEELRILRKAGRRCPKMLGTSGGLNPQCVLFEGHETETGCLSKAGLFALRGRAMGLCARTFGCVGVKGHTGPCGNTMTCLGRVNGEKCTRGWPHVGRECSLDYKPVAAFAAQPCQASMDCPLPNGHEGKCQRMYGVDDARTEHTENTQMRSLTAETAQALPCQETVGCILGVGHIAPCRSKDQCFGKVKSDSGSEDQCGLRPGHPGDCDEDLPF